MFVPQDIGDDLTRQGHATHYIPVGEKWPGSFTETIPHIFHLAAEGKISTATETVPRQGIEKVWLQKIQREEDWLLFLKLSRLLLASSKFPIPGNQYDYTSRFSGYFTSFV